MAIPGIANAIGSIFGGAAKGSAENDAAKIDAASRMNDQRLSQYGQQQGAQFNLGALDLNRKQFDESSEAARMKRALLGSLLGNLKDSNVSVAGIPQASVTGGIRASALGQGGQDIAKLMMEMALAKAKAGNTYEGGQILDAPQLQDTGAMRQGGNKFLNALGMIGSAVGGVGSAMGGMRGAQPSQGVSSMVTNPSNMRNVMSGVSFR